MQDTTVCAGAGARDISGTWAFSVDLGPENKFNQTIVFKQEGEKLTGTYSGGMGEHKVTGSLKGNKVAFSFEVTGQPKTNVKVSYTGTIKSLTEMSGAVEYIGGDGRGKWTAIKKK